MNNNELTLIEMEKKFKEDLKNIQIEQIKNSNYPFKTVYITILIAFLVSAAITIANMICIWLAADIIGTLIFAGFALFSLFLSDFWFKLLVEEFEVTKLYFKYKE